MKTTIFIILIFVMSVITSNAQYFELKISPVLGENKQAPGGTFAIAEDKQGFIWFGTLNGLIRYDGYRFKYYKHNIENPNSLSNNNIRALCFDKDGDLWIGTQGGGLDRLDTKTEHFTHYPNDPKNAKSISNNDIWAIAEDREGNLWIGTWGGGLNKMNKKNGEFVHYIHDSRRNSVCEDIIRRIKEDKHGNLWIGTQSGGVSRLNPKTNQFTNFINKPSDPSSLANNENYSIEIDDQNDEVWISTKGGVNIYEQKNDRLRLIRHDPKDPNSLNYNSVYFVAKTKKSKYWIGLSEDGLCTYDRTDNKFRFYKHEKNNPQSLSSDRVRFIFEDSNGIVWVGSETGVDKIVEQQNFLLYRPKARNENETNIVRSIYEDNSGRLWIGMLNHTFACYDKNAKEYITKAQLVGLPEANVITAMVEDDDQNFWVGTNDGIFVFDQNKKMVRKYLATSNPSNGLCCNTIQRIINAHNGEMWIGTENGLCLFNQKTNSWTSFFHDPAQANSISSNKIQPYALLLDKDKTLWIGTWAGGLNKYSPKDKSFKHFLNNPKNKNSICNNNIISLYGAADGTIWIGSFGGGLDRFDPKTETFKNYSELDGLSSNTIFCIEGDRSGNLWLSTDNGISMFNVKTEKIHQFSMNDGLQSNQFFWGAGFQSKTGEIFFGGTDGLTCFHPNNIQLNRHAPTVKFIDAKIFDQSMQLPKSILYMDRLVFKHNETNIRIDFVATDYTDPSKNQYAYKLKGIDENWIKNGNSNTINFSNISPGRYTLLVKASNNDGIWNPSPSAIEIVVLPPWWATWWFRTILFIVIVGGSIGFYYVRISNLKKNQRKLEQKVKERTQELQDANLRLTEQQLEIVQQNEEIKQQAEELVQQRDMISETLKKVNEQHEHIKGSIRYAQTIQKAILPSESKLLQNINSFVIYRPKDVVSGDFYWFYEIGKAVGTGKFGKALIATVDCTGHGVPGAFMSMIGSRLLSEIVVEQGITDPAQILNALSIGVYHSLNQGESANEDGMDLSICLLENIDSSIKLTFSGSKTSIFHFNALENKIMRYKGDRKNIGGSRQKTTTSFTNTEVILSTGDCIYLYTDGFVDQNNKARIRFGSKLLEKLLEKVSMLPIMEQKKAIEEELDSWQEGELQRDDITFLGIKI